MAESGDTMDGAEERAAANVRRSDPKGERQD